MMVFVFKLGVVICLKLSLNCAKKVQLECLTLAICTARADFNYSKKGTKYAYLVFYVIKITNM